MPKPPIILPPPVPVSEITSFHAKGDKKRLLASGVEHLSVGDVLFLQDHSLEELARVEELMRGGFPREFRLDPPLGIGIKRKSGFDLGRQIEESVGPMRVKAAKKKAAKKAARPSFHAAPAKKKAAKKKVAKKKAAKKKAKKALRPSYR